MPDQKPMWTRCLGGFSVMWVTKLLISPVKKRIFCSKMTKFSPKLAFLSIAGSFGALLMGWLAVVARAVSRKKPIYFIFIHFVVMSFLFCETWIFSGTWNEKKLYIKWEKARKPLYNVQKWADHLLRYHVTDLIPEQASDFRLGHWKCLFWSEERQWKLLFLTLKTDTINGYHIWIYMDTSICGFDKVF